ncbi:Os11g0496013 [Oryza sativa Japonica Group]|uniref:Os11g0496013 protein n=1 Tax=Oryza sativa subsp. japonica TaxID=39947 RepID=A0A0P0Y3B0_ORYSJ|nr:hypothetical protein EE612_055664 [Oryza sativa]BAT14112.1 Os11g0496013 [Oryza sativa Japonica Group]
MPSGGASAAPRLMNAMARSQVRSWHVSHLASRAAASPTPPSPAVLAMVNTATVGGTIESFSRHDTTTPKLSPPPPRIAQKRSSPMRPLSRSSPSAFTIMASSTLSAPIPNLRIMSPIPPPLR